MLNERLKELRLTSDELFAKGKAIYVEIEKVKNEENKLREELAKIQDKLDKNEAKFDVLLSVQVAWDQANRANMEKAA